MNTEYPKTFKDLIRPIKTELSVTVLLSFLGTLSLLIAPIAITVAIEKFITNDTNSFITWVIIAGVGLGLKQFLHMESLGYAHKMEAKFRYMLRKDFSKKLSRLPLGFFSNTSSGAIRKFVSEDTIKIHTIIAHAFSEMTAGLTLPIACSIVMLIFEWHTALMIIAFTILIVFIGFFWMNAKSKGLKDISERYEVAQREMSHSAIEMVDGIKEIKNFGMSGSLFKRFDENLHTFSTVSFEWLNTASKAFSFMSAAIQPTVLLFVSLLICIFSIKHNWLAPSQTILFMLLGINLPTSLIGLLQLGNHIKDGQHSVNTLLELYAKEDQKYKEKPAEFKLGNIEFKGVSFSYDNEHKVLDDINCIIEKGKLTALVGPSGGGKTTMARLIARFWDAKDGELSIGDINIKDLSETDLLSNISLVFQDISLMHASIADNIALSKANASRAEIEEAAKSALIHERIMQLPKGYDSIYGEDSVVLSGGEKQRLTIARAFLANSPIILLDEATAQADAESELEIQKALSRLGKDKTVVMIAHRLSSIVNADQILVINNGKIEQKGTHKELVNQAGTYQRMWNAQNINKEEN